MRSLRKGHINKGFLMMLEIKMMSYYAKNEFLKEVGILELVFEK